jgi:nucleotide-binding universal stress UspA family protein
MKMLILAVDSQQYEATLHFGSLVAKALSTDTTLLGVLREGQEGGELSRAVDSAARELAALGINVSVRVESNQPQQIVVTELKKDTYDLVAIGGPDSQQVNQALLNLVGSIERAASSVLVIKGDRPSVSRVLVCSSGTEYSRLPVQTAADVAGGSGASVTLLHVLDPMPIMYAGLERMEETMAEFLQSDTERAREVKWALRTLQAECDVVDVELRRGIAGDEILRESEAGDYDLIVLGSSRSGRGLARVLLGDLTQQLILQAQIPVLVVRRTLSGHGE